MKLVSKFKGLLTLDLTKGKSVHLRKGDTLDIDASAITPPIKRHIDLKRLAVVQTPTKAVVKPETKWEPKPDPKPEPRKQEPPKSTKVEKPTDSVEK